VEFIFADDAKQLHPTRLGVGPLVAIGGIHVDSHRVGPLEHELDGCCSDWGFPVGEQFKWSPGSAESFMRTQLVEDRREAFYHDVLTLATSHEVRATVVIEDLHRKPAREQSRDHEHDVTALFLERVSSHLVTKQADGVVVIAKPGGGHREEEKFVAQCIALLDEGTEYRNLANIPLGVFTVQSNRLRLLQLADLVTSCTLARVAGEIRYSHRVFERVKGLFRNDGSRTGGIGLKIHPDFTYANLYHWLLGDEHILRGGARVALPIVDALFGDHPNEAVVMGDVIRAADLRRWNNSE